ncbi:type I restriction-modification system subunit M [Arthrobacter sp. W4I7]|uniref:type I restriction-modification system subunit M n=1 Tax=Arthrobacter sp. W4I7 TaxID=3042296 RepID=UPI002783ECED|nr:type I restriction-modification system subunit M [Arthrobacter sp. W4I7]MDQ0689588.1 type I restriction enzyme M protein [Arthrobacter sp. W4I7]
MALKKSDLYSSLWKSCDELRGGMDASQYKDYILTMLFMKYVSDKAKTDPNSLIEVPVGGSFDDMVALKGDKEIGDKINKIISKLAEANNLENVIDLANFNDDEKLGKAKEMVDRLSKLVTIFQELDFRGSRAEGDDLLGDAYEYLMRHFATESGKSKGQFYTPAEVSRVLAKLIGVTDETPRSATVYDPTCGSGSLLLKVAAESRHGLTIYGQEKDNATWALSKMNMILHGNEIADIRKGDTITNPQFTVADTLDTFNFIVANPPFSIKSWSNGLENEFGRFEYGMPPEKNGDYAFLLHILKSMKSTGKAAVILPHGVLFRGNAEGVIRKQLLKHGFIKGIIGLPANLFYGTGIPACVIVLDKENAQSRTGVFMIDASKGFLKDGNKNRLRSQDMHKIVDTFTNQLEIERYSRMVPLTEISNAANDFNLNIARYIDSSEPDDMQDLYAHLHGGIPNRDIEALSDSWDAFPNLREKLFRGSSQDGYSELTVDISHVQQAILDAAEFTNFSEKIRAQVADWFSDHRSELESIDETTKPNELITILGDDLLDRFKNTPLLNEYDVYERLMTYWHSTMHDDVFLIMNEGWRAAANPRKTIEDKDRKITETPDLVLGSGRSSIKYKMDLIPPALIISRYFASEQTQTVELTAKADLCTIQIEEYTEEHAVEDGLLADAMDEGKITKALVAARLRDVRRGDANDDEVQALNYLLELFNAEASAKKLAKDGQAKLDAAALAQYGHLTEQDVRSLVLEDKWHASITAGITSEIAKLAHNLVARIRELGERYDETVADLESELEEYSAKVAVHLTEMGVK